jgi:4,5-dihydroxyphthalate decarboxylase
MAKLTLTLAAGDYDRVRPLADGTVRPVGVTLNVLFLTPEEMFYRMGRFREFDASEFSLSTYTVLRGRGEDLIAIPVFPSRMFRHSCIYVHEGAGIAAPADLIGKRVGIPKYHMTAAVWIRGMLEDEYGVSPREVTWCEGGEGRAVKEVDIALPPEIRREIIPGDRVLGDLVAAGELDAFVGARMPRAFANGSPGIKRLFPDYRVVEQAYYQKTGLFPIMHTVVIRGELTERHPWLPGSLYDAFCRAKAIALERMADTAALPHTLPWLTAEFEATRALMGPDPWPYGVTANRRPLEALARYAFEQGVAPRHLRIDEMFPASLQET